MNELVSEWLNKWLNKWLSESGEAPKRTGEEASGWASGWASKRRSEPASEAGRESSHGSWIQTLTHAGAACCKPLHAEFTEDPSSCQYSSLCWCGVSSSVFELLSCRETEGIRYQQAAALVYILNIPSREIQACPVLSKAICPVHVSTGAKKKQQEGANKWEENKTWKSETD